MRALKVLGLAEDGVHVVCEEPVSGDRFAIPADDQLRAAARGRLGHGTSKSEMETPMEPQLRPREIQLRIRAGASLDEVAEAANCEPSRIERYAYPVLMERATIAGQARLARPMIAGIAGSRTIEAVVAETLSARGQAIDIAWDAYREPGGAWVLALTWMAGHSQNTARWAFHPGAAGGTVNPVDDAATEIMEPAPRPLRTVREAADVEVDLPPLNPLATATDTAAPVRDGAPAAKPTPAPPRPVYGHGKPSTNKVAAALAHHAVSPSHAQSSRAATQPTDQAASSAQPGYAGSSVGRTGTEDAGRAPARGQRPVMPSWEDVLLGVRSSGQ